MLAHCRGQRLNRLGTMDDRDGWRLAMDGAINPAETGRSPGFKTKMPPETSPLQAVGGRDIFALVLKLNGKRPRRGRAGALDLKLQATARRLHDEDNAARGIGYQ